MDDILVIDSHEPSAATIMKYLTMNGYYCMTMSDGATIGVKLKVSEPDLIIINHELKNESGFDLCKRIRRMDRGRYTPILMLCPNSAVNTQKRTLESGADDFILKDADATTLLSKVKSLLRIKNLSDQLRKQYEELESKNRQMDTQLKMAMRVQRSLISEMETTMNGVNVISRYLPAMEIGGDFYEIIQLNEDSFALIIGDVSGHGISAALLTAMLNMMIRNNASKYMNPAQFLFHMNNEFIDVFENRSDVYACLFYALINSKEKRIYYSNAGQALPIHVRADGARELEASGTPIGMIRDSIYEHRIDRLSDGDLLLFYTDGLSDNLYKDDKDEFYARVKTLLFDKRLSSSPVDIADSLINAFYHDSRGPGVNKYEMDDVSIILCKITDIGT